jgi:mannan endo-1,4-beta-mannosidase
MEKTSLAPAFTLSNPNASKEAKDLMAFLKRIQGRKIITGQHCNKATCPDIEYIKRVTGKTPAIIGLDLLSYSNWTYTKDATWDCIDELVNNEKSIEAALYWAKEKKAIITLCWHWFSPLVGEDKSFYTKHTPFDLEAALQAKGEAYEAIIKDLDTIAVALKRLRDEKIPVLWRPLHEAEGAWFWWGAKGPEAYKALYRIMYQRYTEYHGLDNLIWVWNAPEEGWYPGDDVVDINSIDRYFPKKEEYLLEGEFEKAIALTGEAKPIALGEIGSIPELGQVMQTSTWLWFMVWNSFQSNEEWNTKEALIRNYNSDYAITLENLHHI